MNRVVKSGSIALPLLYSDATFTVAVAIVLLLMVEKNDDGNAATFSPVFLRYELPLPLS